MTTTLITVDLTDDDGLRGHAFAVSRYEQPAAKLADTRAGTVRIYERADLLERMTVAWDNDASEASFMQQFGALDRGECDALSVISEKKHFLITPHRRLGFYTVAKWSIR